MSHSYLLNFQKLTVFYTWTIPRPEIHVDNSAGGYGHEGEAYEDEYYQDEEAYDFVSWDYYIGLDVIRSLCRDIYVMFTLFEAMVA